MKRRFGDGFAAHSAGEYHPRLDPAWGQEQIKKCTRCGNFIEECIDSNICGTCADDLREEKEA